MVLPAILILLLLVSCARQVTKPLDENDLAPKKAPSVAHDRNAAKKSAGGVIYGDPEKVELFTHDKKLVFSPGDKSYSEITRVCERIVLRVGTPAGWRPVSDTEFSKIMKESYAVVRLTYRREPVFVFFGTNDYIKRNKNLTSAAGLNEITFFLPANNASMTPDTIYDGFYYGNIHMVSTLTNTELVELIKGLQSK